MSVFHRYLVPDDAERADLCAAAEAGGWRCVADVSRSAQRGRELGWEIDGRHLHWVELHSLDARLLLVEDGLELPEVCRRWALVDAERAITAIDGPRSLTRAVALTGGEVTAALAAHLDAALEGDLAARRAALFAVAFRRTPELDAWIDEAVARYPAGDERHDVLARLRDGRRAQDAGEHTWDLAIDDVRALYGKLEEARRAGHHVRVIAAADRILAQEYHDTELDALTCRALARRARGERWHALVDGLVARAIATPDHPVPEDVAPELEAMLAELLADPPPGPAPADALAILAPAEKWQRAETLGVFATLAGLDTGHELELRWRWACTAFDEGETEVAAAQARWVAEAKPRSRAAAALLTEVTRGDARVEALRRWLAPLDEPPEDPALEARLEQLADHHIIVFRPAAMIRDLLQLRQGAGAPQAELTALAERGVELAPDSALSWLDLGMVRTGEERHADAVAAYTNAIERHAASESEGVLYVGDSFSVAWFNRACERAMCGDEDGAIEDLAAACRMDAKWIEDARTDDYFDALRGDPRFEAILAGELPEAPPGAAGGWDARYREAKAATFSGEWDAALCDAEEALELATTPSQRVDTLSLVCFAATWCGEVEQAVEAGREAVALLAEHGDTITDRPAEPHHMLAGALQGAGDYDGAAAHYERARAIQEARHGGDHPLVAKVWVDQARLCAARGDDAEAAAHVERGLAILTNAVRLPPAEAERREVDVQEAQADLIVAANNLLFLRRRTGAHAAALEAGRLAVSAYESYPGRSFSLQVLKSLAVELDLVGEGDPALAAEAQALIARLERRYQEDAAGPPPDAWDHVTDDLARLRDELALDDARLADVLQGALRGQSPPPDIARVPGAAASLVRFASLATQPGSTLPVMAAMSIDLLRAGARSFDEVLDDLAALGRGP